MSARRHGPVACAAALVATAWARPAAAEPGFALREGAPCVLCHVDPAGGGMRNDYARGVYGPAVLTGGGVGAAEVAGPAEGRVSRSVAFGSDVRLLYHHLDKVGADRPRVDSFYLMQAALYAAADLGRQATVYVAPALHGAETVSFDAMALVRLPVDGAYVKAGRFAPAYGLRGPDHTVFVRKRLGFHPLGKDTGVEAGWDAPAVSVSAAVVNGVTDAGLDWDDNVGKAFWARVAARAGGPRLRAMLGASGAHNVSGLGPSESPAGAEGRVGDQRAGVFAGLAAGRLRWMGEADLRRYDDLSATAAVTSFASYQELVLVPAAGVEVSVTFELFDPDVDVDGDAARRYGVAARVLALAGTELALGWRRTFADDRADLAGMQEGLAMAHLFF